MRAISRAVRRTNEPSFLELANTMGATVGIAPCDDIKTLKKETEEQIDFHEAELDQLIGVRAALAGLVPRRRRRWVPGPGTAAARILGLFRGGIVLTRAEIINALAAAGEPVLDGTVSAMLSKLAEHGWVANGRDGWKLIATGGQEQEG